MIRLGKCENQSHEGGQFFDYQSKMALFTLISPVGRNFDKDLRGQNGDTIPDAGFCLRLFATICQNLIPGGISRGESHAVFFFDLSQPRSQSAFKTFVSREEFVYYI